MKNEKQFIVFLENRPGTIAELCELVAKQGVNIRAFSLSTSNEFGAARMLVSDPGKIADALKPSGYRFIQREVITLEAANESGEAAKKMKKLAEAGININCFYFSVDDSVQKALWVLDVPDIEKAMSALE